LGGFMLAMVAAAIPQLAAFALARYRAVATIAIVVVLADAGLSIAAATTDRLEVLAVAASTSTALMLVGLLIVVYESEAMQPLVAVVRELVLPAALATVTFGAAWCLTLLVPGRAGDVALAVVGAGAYTIALRALLPDHWQLVRRLLAPLAQLSARARQASPAAD
jgi:hypothetical protein